MVSVTQSDVSLSVKLMTDVYTGIYNYLLGFSYDDLQRFAELLRHRVDEFMLGNLIVWSSTPVFDPSVLYSVTIHTIGDAAKV